MKPKTKTKTHTEPAATILVVHTPEDARERIRRALDSYPSGQTTLQLRRLPSDAALATEPFSQHGRN